MPNLGMRPTLSQSAPRVPGFVHATPVVSLDHQQAITQDSRNFIFDLIDMTGNSIQIGQG
jgi:hypothetical protein